MVYINIMQEAIQSFLETSKLLQELYNKKMIDEDEFSDKELEMSRKFIELANKNNEDKLAKWIELQERNFKTKSGSMKDPIKYNKWKEFINNSKYSKHFCDN